MHQLAKESLDTGKLLDVIVVENVSAAIQRIVRSMKKDKKVITSLQHKAKRWTS